MSLPFHVTAQAFALTYANLEQQTNQTNDDAAILPTKEDIGELLSDMEEGKQFIVAAERHEEGQLHYHAFMQFRGPVTVDHTTFDLEWNTNHIHPNIQGLSTPLDVLKWCRYLKKEDPEPLYVHLEAEQVMEWLASPPDYEEVTGTQDHPIQIK